MACFFFGRAILLLAAAEGDYFVQRTALRYNMMFTVFFVAVAVSLYGILHEKRNCIIVRLTHTLCL